MRSYFFDTSAIIPRYVRGPFATRINRVLSASNSDHYISELSVIEVSSTLAQHVRRHRQSVGDFRGMRDQFEDDIAVGLLKVRAISAIDLRNARDLLEDAAVINGRNLRSADAIIAASCRELAHTLGRRIIFYTKDWAQYSSVYGVAAYRSVLKLRYLGAGRGGIPPLSG